MPQIEAEGKKFECELGANLRQALLRQGVALHNDRSQVINCRGLGTCGTCAVQIIGQVSVPNWRDRSRRALPPHALQQNRRLACQTQVLGDLKITKYDGFWGQGEQVRWLPEG